MKGLRWIGLWAGALLFSLAWAGEEPSKKFTETVTGGKANKKASFDMVLIPGGKFMMGTPDGEAGHKPPEGPTHEVEVKPFYLAATELTLDLFLMYYDETSTSARGVEAEKKSAEREKIDGISCPTVVYGDMTMGWGVEGRPAIGISWRNAVNVCKWLSKKTGRAYRLPTEAEWEFACRAGTKTGYSFGDDAAKLGDHAWCKDNADEKTQPVAKKQPNAFGLYDMHGNVKEWVQDFYSTDGYANDAKAGTAVCPTGPKEGKVHVARGGSYDDEAADLRSGARAFQEDWWQFKDPQEPKSKWWLPEMAFIGMRIACVPEEKK